MNVKVNANYLNLKKNYLFSEIARRVAEYSSANPQKRIVRLGIGDVTLPLTPSVTDAMAKAVAEMGKKETFQGYPPSYGYDFLLKAISAHYA
ncbi:MAG: LL-diaminopimelate aminotransferase, partial [Clostridia bacterium]|nr:LL-diaminopimelate aminotransferase [Clostridia bacterium]